MHKTTTLEANVLGRPVPVSTISSPLAARRMQAFLETNQIGQTDFAGRVGTTDRTLRSFRKSGKVRSDIFAAIVKAMGTTKETLLKPE